MTCASTETCLWWHKRRAYVTNRLYGRRYINPSCIHEGCIATAGVRKPIHIHRPPHVAELRGDRVRGTRIQTPELPAVQALNPPNMTPTPIVPLTARITNKDEIDERFVLYLLWRHFVYSLVARHCFLPYISSLYQLLRMPLM